MIGSQKTLLALAVLIAVLGLTDTFGSGNVYKSNLTALTSMGGACSLDSQCESGYCDLGTKVCRTINIEKPAVQFNDLKAKASGRDPGQPEEYNPFLRSPAKFIEGRKVLIGTQATLEIDGIKDSLFPLSRPVDVKYTIDGEVFNRTVDRPNFMHARPLRYIFTNHFNNYPALLPTRLGDDNSEINGKLAWLTTPGDHTITVTVDPSNKIKELNEGDNTARVNVTVVGQDGKPYNPNLTGVKTGDACSADNQCASKFCGMIDKVCHAEDLHRALPKYHDIVTTNRADQPWPHIDGSTLIAGHKYVIGFQGDRSEDGFALARHPLGRPIKVRTIIDGVVYDRTISNADTCVASHCYYQNSDPLSNPTVADGGQILWTATPGIHTIETIVDPNNEISEYNSSDNTEFNSNNKYGENNNNTFGTFSVSGVSTTPDDAAPVTNTDSSGAQYPILKSNTLVTNRTYQATFTMKNTGTATWSSANTDTNYYAIGQVGQSTFGVDRIKLPPGESIAPGATKKFVTTLTMPATPGFYTFNWRMMKVTNGVAVGFGGIPDMHNGVTVYSPISVYPSFASPYFEMTPNNKIVVRVGSAPITLVAQICEHWCDSPGSVTWTSGDPTILSIGSEGSVTRNGISLPTIAVNALSPGVASVTASTGADTANKGMVTFVVVPNTSTTGINPISVGTSTGAVLVNGATCVSITAPDTVTPSQKFTGTVIVKNTGTTVWGKTATYQLGGEKPNNNFVWNAYRINLPVGTVVAPGATATFTINATAPATVGTRPFAWKALQKGVEWFGDICSKNIVITTTNTASTSSSGGGGVVQKPTRAAEFVSQDVPREMEVGKNYSVVVTMKNTGSQSWTDTAGYRLGTASPRNNRTFVPSGRANLSSSDTIATDQNKTFTILVTAPTVTGTYTFQMQMFQQGVTWFGSTTPAVKVTVTGPAPIVSTTPVAEPLAAQFISAQSVMPPTSMTVGQTLQVSVAMKNAGSESWVASAAPTGLNEGDIALGADNPLGNFTWNMFRTPLAPNEVVAPGQTKIFNFTITAPTTPGDYNFQVKMIKQQVKWFGDSTPNIVITVH